MFLYQPPFWNLPFLVLNVHLRNTNGKDAGRCYIHWGILNKICMSTAILDNKPIPLDITVQVLEIIAIYLTNIV